MTGVFHRRQHLLQPNACRLALLADPGPEQWERHRSFSLPNVPIVVRVNRL